MKNVVIFSPSRFSLYTICVVELLKQRDICVSAIVVKKLFSPKRFFSEFSRDGSRLLKKIWKKLILRQSGYTKRSYKTIINLMQENNISVKRVDEFTTRYDIPIIYCNDLNEPAVAETLKKTKPDLVIFTGGGLIRKAVLDHSGEGILNCHMGILPKYRGMDVVEWPILEDNPNQVGMTVHFMDEGVDTGDILRIQEVPIIPHETIQQLRERFEPIMCRTMVDTCCDYLNHKLERRSQKLKEGKQYFIMHPELVDVAKHKMKLL
ncbi:MAG: formyl transferase [Planctomycetia bacterium]|jgi:folate-dependent phosphoribosylglycinamide formyltransferase PurN